MVLTCVTIVTGTVAIIWMKEILCLMEINCKLRYFDNGRISSFTKLKLAKRGREQASV